MTKIMKISAVFLLAACAFVLTGCPALSASSGETVTPSAPSLQTYVLKAEKGKASLTLKDYNTSTFSGRYTFVSEKDITDPDSEDYTENGTFTIIKNFDNSKNPWLFTKLEKKSTDAIDRLIFILENKIFIFEPSGYKFNLKDVPLP